MLKIFAKKNASAAAPYADKCSELIELYGCLDELSSFIGWCTEATHGDNSAHQTVELSSLAKQLYHIQRQLISLGEQLAFPKKTVMITGQHVAALTTEVENISNKLPVLKSFILPGGGEIASRLHIARAVCRRAERAACHAVAAKHQHAGIAADYLNRLSSWFFIAARYAAFVSNVEEIPV